MPRLMERGLDAVKAGNNAAAAEWFAKVLEKAPEDLQAQAWLGQALCRTGRRIDGLARLRQAGLGYLQTTPQGYDLGKVLEITMLLQSWSDFDGALDLLGQAVRINPSDHRAFNLLASTYSQLNRTAEALNAGRAALELDPENSMYHILQASLEADAGMLEAAKLRLLDALSYEMDAREEFRARKELARVLDRLREYEEVFPHLEACARLSESLPEFTCHEKTFLPKMIRSNTEEFSRELLGRWASIPFPPELPPPTFLVGFMRSGTTLTQEILDAHPDVVVADEADFIWATHQELHRIDRSPVSTAAKLRKLELSEILHLRRFYWSRVRGRFGDSVGERMLVDKFTMNTIDLGLINCIFPDAKVLFLLRDPRDISLSCLLQLMVPSPATVHLLSLQETAALYARVMEWWLQIRSELTLSYLEVRYEDLVKNFETTCRELFDFLGLRWEPAVANFHQHAAGKHIASPSRKQVAQPLYSSSVHRWQRYSAHFEQVSHLLDPFVHAFGYQQVSLTGLQGA